MSEGIVDTDGTVDIGEDSPSLQDYAHSDETDDMSKMYDISLAANTIVLGNDVCHLVGESFRDKVKEVLIAQHDAGANYFKNLDAEADLARLIEEVEHLCKYNANNQVDELPEAVTESDDALCEGFYHLHSDSPASYDDKLKCGKWSRLRELAFRMVSLDNNICRVDADQLEDKVERFRHREIGSHASMIEGTRFTDHVAAVCESQSARLRRWSHRSREQQYSYCAKRYAESTLIEEMDDTDKVRCHKWFVMEDAAQVYKVAEEVCHLEGDELRSEVERIFRERSKSTLFGELDSETDVPDFVHHVEILCKSHH